MNVPRATYRIQFSSSFTLKDLQEVLPYLEELGISTIYASPIFQARMGSTHGYDVVDPLVINSEIGKLETFQEIGDTLQEKRMNWLQDIVPNHMAFDGNNLWLKEIFELGANSHFFDFFDIDWNYFDHEQVMAPFLGAPLEEILKKKELQLKMDKEGFWFTYYDHKYPLNYRSYPMVLDQLNLVEWNEKFLDFSGKMEEWKNLKSSFFQDVTRSGELKSTINREIDQINESVEKVREILSLQFFKPVHWKQTEEEINYRRFFTINDLICLKMENLEVFESYHKFSKELFEKGYIHSFRLDHIDGLFAPTEYLKRLRNYFGPNTYIIVEKILEAEEKLPKDWPVQGSSGYDFLAMVNQLFTKQENKEAFSDFYKSLSEENSDYQQLVYKKKLFILQNRMKGELKNLSSFLLNSGLLPKKEEVHKKNWEDALCHFLAAFPVYRIYAEKFPLNPQEKEIIEFAYLQAREMREERAHELKQLKAIFLGETEGKKDKMIFFLQRSQQFTGPLAAKGVEDTAFYIYNRLVSHNEVGDSPQNFGISSNEFHQKLLHRNQHFPYSMNTTSTHDTKRGEDARMRLNVLSEIPSEWFKMFDEWKELSKEHKEGREGPSLNEEYFIYQTLLAGKGFGEKEDEFVTRTKEYLQKVLREAKLSSNWSEPNEKYEQEVQSFIEEIFRDGEFRRSFDPFQERIAYYGALKSLGQLLIKLTAPGVPDIYQGTELWDFSYVDPDNRREVDFKRRKKLLKEFTSWQTEKDFKEKISPLVRNFDSGEIKMFALYRTLQIRSNNEDIFRNGKYIPLEINAPFSEKIVAYARMNNDKWVIVIVPLEVTAVFQTKGFVPVPDLGGAKMFLPNETPLYWRNTFTGSTFKAEGGLNLEDIFKDFPVALLESKKDEEWN